MKLGTDNQMEWQARQQQEWNRRAGRMFITILIALILMGSTALVIFLSR